VVALAAEGEGTARTWVVGSAVAVGGKGVAERMGTGVTEGLTPATEEGWVPATEEGLVPAMEEGSVPPTEDGLAPATEEACCAEEADATEATEVGAVVEEEPIVVDLSVDVAIVAVEAEGTETEEYTGATPPPTVAERVHDDVMLGEPPWT